MTGGVLMSKNNLLLGFILGLMATFFLLSAGARPYPCLSSTGEDLENDKTFAGNELGE